MLAQKIIESTDLKTSKNRFPDPEKSYPNLTEVMPSMSNTHQPQPHLNPSSMPFKTLKSDLSDSFPQLNFLKNRENSRQNSKQPRTQYIPRKSVSKEMRNPFFNKMPIRLHLDRQKSHEKIPQKMKASREFFKLAMPEPILVDQSHLNEKVKIIHNLFCKQDKYFYCNRVDIRTLVRNIYYQGYTVDSLQEFKLTAFKRIKHQQEFFGIIYEEGKNFTSTAHRAITSHIEKLIDKSEGGKTGNKLGTQNQTPVLPVFLPFLSHAKKYQSVVNTLYSQFKHLEQVNVEIEKLTRHFIKFFLEKHSYECEGFNFHSRLFVIYIYNNQLIFRFFDQLFKTFKRNRFYEEKYPIAFEQVYEIYEDSKQHITEINISQSANNQSTHFSRREIFGQPTGQFIGDGGVDNGLKDVLSGQNINSNIQPLKVPLVIDSEKLGQNKTVISGVPEENENKGLTKKKKKKKNKKKNLAENSTILLDDLNRDGVVDVENVEELEELRSFEEKLVESDWTYQIKPVDRLRVVFNEKEIEVFKSLIREIKS